MIPVNQYSAHYLDDSSDSSDNETQDETYPPPATTRPTSDLQSAEEGTRMADDDDPSHSNHYGDNVNKDDGFTIFKYPKLSSVQEKQIFRIWKRFKRMKDVTRGKIFNLIGVIVSFSAAFLGSELLTRSVRMPGEFSY